MKNNNDKTERERTKKKRVYMLNCVDERDIPYCANWQYMLMM